MKKIIEILSNPLLYYVDKSGNSVFRNYCLFSYTGNLYRTTIPKANVGNALEYRFKLDKYLKLAYFFTPVILYFIFIHVKFSIFSLLFFEFLLLLIINGVRVLCSSLFSEFLVRQFGRYELTEFTPPVPKVKIDGYVALFRSKIIAWCILIGLFFLPAFALQGVINYNLVKKHNKAKQAIKLSNIYFSIYPKCIKVYDMRAFGKFMSHDYEGALDDYKAIMEMSGKKFTQKDLMHFANLLLLQKKVTTPQDAVDIFNEYITQKNLSVLESSQMLWIKSIFKIENNIAEDVMQDYDDLLESLDAKDSKNQFYISSDKAYMLYLLKDYAAAVNEYNILIAYAQENKDLYTTELKSLYAERGWAKKRMGEELGAQDDFANSGIEIGDLQKYEPTYSAQEFVVDKF